MFVVDIKSRTPIYEQIVRGFAQKIIRGDLAAGEKIPTVREFASTNGINPNTVQKAYKILEERGYFHTAPGQGSFASRPPPAELARERAALYDKIRACAEQLLLLGESPQNVASFVQKLGGENDHS